MGEIFNNSVFLSSLAALAQKPDRIKDLFRNTEYSKNGIFELYLYEFGEKIKVIVDDRLAVSGDSPILANKSSNGAWWAPIVEKAAGKYYGSQL